MNRFENEKYIIEIKIILNLKKKNPNQFFVKFYNKEKTFGTHEFWFETKDFLFYRAKLLELGFDLTDIDSDIYKSIYDLDMFIKEEDYKAWRKQHIQVDGKITLKSGTYLLHNVMLSKKLKYFEDLKEDIYQSYLEAIIKLSDSSFKKIKTQIEEYLSKDDTNEKVLLASSLKANFSRYIDTYMAIWGFWNTSDKTADELIKRVE
jgi:hypothetical protein